MKTPETIKKGLVYCNGNHPNCSGCPYDTDEDYENKCLDDLQVDALDYIVQLESRLAQVERESDSMSYDMHQLQGALCSYCENLYRVEGVGTVSCRVFGNDYGGEDGVPLICGRFKWRGICPENTKEE